MCVFVFVFVFMCIFVCVYLCVFMKLLTTHDCTTSYQLGMSFTSQTSPENRQEFIHILSLSRYIAINHGSSGRRKCLMF